MAERNENERQENADKTERTVRRLSGKDIIINAIPLMFALLVVVFFVYSCRENQEAANFHNRFIHEYKASCCEFDNSLEDFLKGNLATDKFQAVIRDTYLPRMKELDATCKTIKPETVQSFPCMEEFRQLIALKIELATLLLEKPLDITQPKPPEISELFKKIAALSTTVQNKCDL